MFPVAFFTLSVYILFPDPPNWISASLLQDCLWSQVTSGRHVAKSSDHFSKLILFDHQQYLVQLTTYFKHLFWNFSFFFFFFGKGRRRHCRVPSGSAQHSQRRTGGRGTKFFKPIEIYNVNLADTHLLFYIFSPLWELFWQNSTYCYCGYFCWTT